MATVEGLKGAIWSAASMGRAKCAVSSSCDVGKAYHNTPPPTVTVGSDTILFAWGWPSAWENSPHKSIVALLNLSGFTAIPYVGSSFQRVFTKDGAPTPDNCSVKYSLVGVTAGGSPTITATTTGC